MNSLIQASKRSDCLMAIFPYRNKGIWTAPYNQNTLRNFSVLPYTWNDIVDAYNEIGTDDCEFEIQYFNNIDFPGSIFYSNSQNGSFNIYQIENNNNGFTLFKAFNNDNDNFSLVIYPKDSELHLRGNHTIIFRRLNGIAYIYIDNILIRSVSSDSGNKPLYADSIPVTNFNGNIHKLILKNLTNNTIVYKAPYNVLYSNGYLKNIMTTYGTLLWTDLDAILDNINYDWEFSIKFNGNFQLNSFNNNAIFKFASMVGWVISWEYNNLLVRYVDSNNNFKIEKNYPVGQFKFSNCEVKFGLLNNKVYIKLYENQILISSIEQEYSYEDFANFRNESDRHYSKFDGTIENLTLTNLTTNKLVYLAPYSTLYGLLNSKPFPNNSNLNIFNSNHGHMWADFISAVDQYKNDNWEFSYTFELVKYDSACVYLFSCLDGSGMWIRMSQSEQSIEIRLNTSKGMLRLLTPINVGVKYTAIIKKNNNVLTAEINNQTSSYTLSDDETFVFGNAINAHITQYDVKIFDIFFKKDNNVIWNYPSTFEEKYNIIHYENTKVENGYFQRILNSHSSYIQILQNDFIKDLKHFTIICDCDLEIYDNSITGHQDVGFIKLGGSLGAYSNSIRIRKLENVNTADIKLCLRTTNGSTLSTSELIFEQFDVTTTNKIGGVYIATIDLNNKKAIIYKDGNKVKELSLPATANSLVTWDDLSSTVNDEQKSKMFHINGRGYLLFDSILSEQEIERLSFKGIYKNFKDNQINWNELTQSFKNIGTDEFYFKVNFKANSFTEPLKVLDTSWSSNQQITISGFQPTYRRLRIGIIKLYNDNINDDYIDVNYWFNDDLFPKINTIEIFRLKNELKVLIDGIVYYQKERSNPAKITFNNVDNTPTPNEVISSLFDGNIFDITLKNLTIDRTVWKASQYDIMK